MLDPLSDLEDRVENARRELLVLFARAPVPGRVKTRLVPPLTSEQAADLYRAMLLDVIDLHADEPAARAIWHDPPEAADWFRANAPSDFALRAQRGRDLGERLAAAFRDAAAEGYGAVVVRGTDSPTLPRARVREAFAGLRRADLVLCPDRDGGYNLIGLREPCDALFSIGMGNETVLARTLERARGAGLRAELLDAHYDVDTARDLVALGRDVASGAAPRTARCLAELRDSIAP
jgi:rSAM/selenodomain-associated transferase 1